MSKVILQFTKGHGRYVKGDVAGFDSVTAQKLRGVTMPYNAAAKVAVVEVNALDAREKELDARELELETRLAAVGGLSALATEPAAGDPPVQGNKAAAGDPPVEGSKVAAGDPPAQGNKSK